MQAASSRTPCSQIAKGIRPLVFMIKVCAANVTSFVTARSRSANDLPFLGDHPCNLANDRRVLPRDIELKWTVTVAVER